MSIFSKIPEFLGFHTYRSYRLTIRAIALFLGLSAGFFMNVELTMNKFEAAFCCFLVVLVAAFLEFIFADDLADQSFPFDTLRKLSLIEKRLGADTISTISNRLQETIGQFRGCDRDCVSATVHVIAELNVSVNSPTKYGLLQLTDYVGPEGGRKGRITLFNQGIIGRCARTEEMETVDFSDATEYQNSMVREFGFTKEETKRHTATARSYLAYPLKSDERLIGVIYFFTLEPQVFPKAVDANHLCSLAKECVNYLKIAQLA